MDTLQDTALHAFEAALEAAHPGRAVERALAHVELPPDLDVLAMGKAAASMWRGARRVLGDRARRVLVVSDRRPSELPFPATFVRGEHPLPGRKSVAAARAVEDFTAEAQNPVLVLLSGGASAVVGAPLAPLTLEDLAATTRLLLDSGVPVEQMNIVRKHLSRVHGGRLALKLAVPARVLVLSDVVDPDPGLVGSGPLCADPSTWADVAAVLQGLPVPRAVVDLVARGAAGAIEETPKPGDPRLESVVTRTIADNRSAVEGAAAHLRGLGWQVHTMVEPVTGDARAAGERLVRLLLDLPPRSALVSGGETTARVRGAGRGGRNLELALGAAATGAGEKDWALLSAGTDGVDGNSGLAGGIVDGKTKARLKSAGMRIDDLFATSNAAALEVVGDALTTGPTKTNVADVQVGLRGPI